MQLAEILTPKRCQSNIDGVSKNRILNKISALISEDILALESDQVFNALMAREHLGSTGLGNGIAIPHCRMPECEKIVGALITLNKPIDFDAVDGKPVDLLFLLIVPEARNDEHVQTLAKLAALFSDDDFCYTLRHTNDSDDLYNIAITY
ncbi:MAG: PTS IIA-like nitrogen-regulatory protein PtsN [SAR86 cluster bacterium]|uniref:PTS IIA-like nitrogen-regulatory protein PtsN n=1 Tax=SAR86 cluster bacterium TaxID=2030880 RepID=A0A2A5ANZ4_9GAMM|nr:MAG: PTS IIA-like nitrogen-regulatory protein PtsN [SAR86 cluster bacterium]